jgi:hypothetical protein
MQRSTQLVFCSDLYLNPYAWLTFKMACVACGEERKPCCVGGHCTGSDAVCTTELSMAGPRGEALPKNSCVSSTGANANYCDALRTCDAAFKGNVCSPTNTCECTQETKGLSCGDRKVCDPGAGALPTQAPGASTGGGTTGGATDSVAFCKDARSVPPASSCGNDAVGMCFDSDNAAAPAQCLPESNMDPSYRCPDGASTKCRFPVS